VKNKATKTTGLLLLKKTKKKEAGRRSSRWR